ncbi:hypothetical protein Tcan_08481 [Toxocara canis]|uniref:Uncharacterized protein n=1 Tax=Toxocara canis TaxID=6265 RepID=A0A0B2VUS0_TOXCA|nr:hypothetical protein Tcan_08481 [Toxocara canis]
MRMLTKGIASERGSCADWVTNPPMCIPNRSLSPGHIPACLSGAGSESRLGVRNSNRNKLNTVTVGCEAGSECLFALRLLTERMGKLLAKES